MAKDAGALQPGRWPAPPQGERSGPPAPEDRGPKHAGPQAPGGEQGASPGSPKAPGGERGASPGGPQAERSGKASPGRGLRRTGREANREALLASVFGSEVPPSLDDTLLRTSDVAGLFRVSERTVSAWARRGRIPSVRTPGGQRRYPAEQIRRLLPGSGSEPLEGR